MCKRCCCRLDEEMEVLCNRSGIALFVVAMEKTPPILLAPCGLLGSANSHLRRKKEVMWRRVWPVPFFAMSFPFSNARILPWRYLILVPNTDLSSCCTSSKSRRYAASQKHMSWLQMHPPGPVLSCPVLLLLFVCSLPVDSFDRGALPLGRRARLWMHTPAVELARELQVSLACAI